MINDLSLFQDWFTLDWTIIAQSVEDPDVIGQMRNAFTEFVDSGKMSVLILGLVLGWFLRYFLRG